VVRAIQEVSGWVWDDETGASITPHTASSWDDYVQSHPEIKPFRNKGWPYFAKTSLLMPTTALSVNVFHPTAPQDKDHSSPSPPEPNSVPKLNEPSAEGSDGDEVSMSSILSYHFY
jgi:hypothetical protein